MQCFVVHLTVEQEKVQACLGKVLILTCRASACTIKELLLLQSFYMHVQTGIWCHCFLGR